MYSSLAYILAFTVFFLTLVRSIITVYITVLTSNKNILKCYGRVFLGKMDYTSEHVTYVI